MTTHSVISIRDLTKQFGERVAVNIPELDIAAGTCTGIIGPNGAGKTTLVKLVAGLLTPTRASRLEVLGSDLTRAAKQTKRVKQTKPAKQLSRSIGLVTNAQQLYGTLTVRENLEYMARLSRIPKKERPELIEKALAACALADRQDDKVMTLSTGLKQRANIARALAARPRLLLLDEPTSGLDPAAAQGVYDALLGLQAGGISMILCTHVMNEIDDLCHRVLFMNEGRIITDATPAKMKELAGERVYTITAESEAQVQELRAQLAERGLSHTGIRRSESHFLLSVYGCEDARVIDELGVPYTKAQASLNDAFVLLSGQQNEG